MDANPASAGLPVTIIGEIAQSLSAGRDQSPRQQADRARLATETIEAFRPGDAIEAMLAGHCVMFHALIVEGVRYALSDAKAAGRRAEYRIVIAMDKAFGNNLTRLEAYRDRAAEAAVEAPPAPARAETDIAERIQRHLAPVPGGAAAAAPVATRRDEPAAFAGHGKTKDNADDNAEPGAFAAHDKTDPARFAIVPRADRPAEAAPAVSPRMAGVGDAVVLNPAQAQRSIYAGNRQARRHPNS